MRITAEKMANVPAEPYIQPVPKKNRARHSEYFRRIRSQGGEVRRNATAIASRGEMCGDRLLATILEMVCAIIAPRKIGTTYSLKVRPAVMDHSRDDEVPWILGVGIYVFD
jgi:hypothetical protein